MQNSEVCILGLGTLNILQVLWTLCVSVAYWADPAVHKITRLVIGEISLHINFRRMVRLKRVYTIAFMCVFV